MNNKKRIEELNFIAGESVAVKVFLKVYRNCGNIVFLEVNDITGVIQVFIKDKEIIEKSRNLKFGSLLFIKGHLNKKISKTKLPFSDWEIVCSELDIISNSDIPFPIDLNNPINSEKTEYRYLFLKKENIQKNLFLRSQIKHIISDFLITKKFIDIDTPVLSASSNEGANPFKTEILLNKNVYEFTLSQSPQLYKQLLMIGNIDSYFQFAKAFRNEDLRSDRQFEFTQIDIETSYWSVDELFSLVEAMMNKVNSIIFKNELNISFSRFSYDDVLKKYGIDKPDLRESWELIDLGNYIYALEVDISFDHRDLKLSQINDGKWFFGNYNKKLNYRFKENSFVIVVESNFKDHKLTLWELGIIRNLIISQKHKNEQKLMKFLWIVDWPMFIFNEHKQNWELSHHLFTKRKYENKDIFKDKSTGFDLVLNGSEIASGSQRNNDLKEQIDLFKKSGISEEEINNSFGWFLKAFNYGVPPHCGLAIGFDRLVQKLLNENNIKDLIAFPKNNHGFCKMSNCPKLKIKE